MASIEIDTDIIGKTKKKPEAALFARFFERCCNRTEKPKNKNFCDIKRRNDKIISMASNCNSVENQEQITRLLFGEQSEPTCNAVLNENEDDEMFITGYSRSKLRTTVCWIFIILTFGSLRLVLHWWRHWFLLCTHSKCPLDKAEKVLVREHFDGKHSVYYVKEIININQEVVNHVLSASEKDKNGRTSGINELIPIECHRHKNDKNFQLSIHYTDGVFKCINSIRLFQCKQLRYIWNEQKNCFVKLMALDEHISGLTLHQMVGLTEEEQYLRRLVYGYNKISIPLKSITTLLFLEVLNPFYCFQVVSVCLWFSYGYYYYAAVIIIMSVFGITMSVIQTRRNQLALYTTVTHSDTANCIRENGESMMIETKLLVPGDILEIPSSGCTMQCDAVLLSGNCIIDESMLTGESVPVTKTPLPSKRDLFLNTKEHARHMLFCGTKVIQTRYIGKEKVLAIVVNTGNKTAKGGLVRSILYPPPVDYKFEQDSYKFIMLLGIAAGVGFLYTLISKILRNVPAIKILIESLDLITIAVPPALPAAMTVGRMYAQKRLKKNNIYCISPRSINVSGSIDCVCFDKTGTLTEDGLDMWGVVPKSSTNYFQIALNQIERLPNDNLLYGMVTCHSLTLMNGELKGDPLDLKMFESTKWLLEEPNVSDDTKYDLLLPTIVRPVKGRDSIDIMGSEMEDNIQIGIVREFSFTSSLQRMSVITRKLNDSNFNVYCKGSPEMIVTLCKKETIPLDFDEKLDVYAQQGYRVIGVAYKPLDKKVNYAKIQRISRDKIECDLEFLGLVILENRLKEDTTSVISSLMTANIRTIMVTGDNILTALSVAKDCGMITKGQSVITVNHRLIQNKENPDGDNKNYDECPFELFYNLTGHPGRDVAAIDNDNKSDVLKNNSYEIMINSCNSVDSLQTVDSCTQITNTTSNFDIESSGAGDHTNHSSIIKTIRTQIANNDKKQILHNQQIDDAACNNYCFAMIGKTWGVINDYYPDLIGKFITRGTVFARMAPDQKQSLIQELQGLGYYVAMCGDGANDCGALKAAHTGISLSEAESSIASPFTSKNPTIACVPSIIKEGRAALVTLFGIFKFMAAYSLVQFSSVLMLYSVDSNLTDFQFLYIDLFLISLFAFFFGKTESYEGPLVKQSPLNSLISLSPIMSLVLQLIVVISIQIIGWTHVQNEDWFEPFNFSQQHNIDALGCYENYTIFTISCFQYITLAFVFSKGAPYRKSIISNYGLLISLVATTIFTIFITIYPTQPFVNILELVVPKDMSFRGYIVMYGLINFVLALIIELLIIEYLLFKKLRYFKHNINKSHRKYLKIEHELRTNTKWPTISSYQGDTQFHNEKETPSSYAEIGVEHATNTVPFDQNSIVLNSFFIDINSQSQDDQNQQNLNPSTINIILNSQNDSHMDDIGLRPSTLDIGSNGIKNVNNNNFSGHPNEINVDNDNLNNNNSNRKINVDNTSHNYNNNINLIEPMNKSTSLNDLELKSLKIS